MADESKKGKYLMTYDREACIGAGACVAVDPEHWELVDDGKADLLGGERTKDNATHTLVFDEEQLDLMRDAAESCPVFAIHIKRLEDGEELI
jgi:ferredoxin